MGSFWDWGRKGTGSRKTSLMRSRWKESGLGGSGVRQDGTEGVRERNKVKANKGVSEHHPRTGQNQQKQWQWVPVGL